MKNNTTKFITNKGYFFLGLILLIIYFLPALILGKNTTIVIHDNLDSEVVYRVVLAISKQAMSFSQSAKIENIMNGIPRACFVSGLNFTLWLYLLFKPIWAYLINDVFVHLIAYIGMYLLIKKHCLKSKNNLIAAGVAFCFSILPYYSILGLVIAGGPLLFFAFLNLIKGEKKYWNYLIILFFPFFTSLIYSVFTIVGLIILSIIFYIRNKRIEKRVIMLLLLFILISFIVDFQLFSQVFFAKNFVSHRVEWNPILWSIKSNKILPQTLNYFTDGQYHAVSQQRLIVILFLPIALLISIFSKKKVKKLLILTSATLFISFFSSFYLWDGLVGLKKKIEVLNVFSFDRFYFLLPLLFFIIFALSLEIIYLSFKKRYLAILIILVSLFIQITYSIKQNIYFQINSYNLIKTIRRQPITSFTFKNFYNEKLFQDIANYIGKPKDSYRVVSIGIEPAVSQYNGFFTLDGYQNNYSLEYKNKFRKIIERQLDKSPSARAYFDDWGSRCYILSTKDLNIEELKSLGGNYIFSNTMIEDPTSGLEFLYKFEGGLSVVYLYKVI